MLSFPLPCSCLVRCLEHPPTPRLVCSIGASGQLSGQALLLNRSSVPVTSSPKYAWALRTSHDLSESCFSTPHSLSTPAHLVRFSTTRRISNSRYALIVTGSLPAGAVSVVESRGSSPFGLERNTRSVRLRYVYVSLRCLDLGGGVRCVVDLSDRTETSTAYSEPLDQSLFADAGVVSLIDWRACVFTSNLTLGALKWMRRTLRKHWMWYSHRLLLATSDIHHCLRPALY